MSVLSVAILATWYLAAGASPALAQGYGNPTVSPYLNLFATDQFGNQQPGVYQTLVRPLIDQRQAAIANRAAINRLQNQVNTGATPYSRAGTGAGTGASNHYFNYSHFYYGLR